MKVNAQEIESVLKLDTFGRYQYFIKRVADSEKMWSLKDVSGNWAIAEIEGNNVFSVWSAPEYAQNCATGQWQGYVPALITLDDFEEKVTGEIEREGYLLNVFSVNDNKSGFVVELTELARDLSDEMKNYR